MTLEQIYAKIPKIQCMQQCHAYCGPVIMVEAEREAIKATMGWSELETVPCGSCPCLDTITKTCNVYKDRPLICRLWGTVRRLQCPLGCQPERWLSDKEADDLIAAYKKHGLTYGFADPEFFKRYGYGCGLKAEDFQK